MIPNADDVSRRAVWSERRRTPVDVAPASRHELLSRAFARAVEFERSLCAGLSDAEREHLMELLQRVGAELACLQASTRPTPRWPRAAPASRR
jgi:hypothetical protein